MTSLIQRAPAGLYCQRVSFALKNNVATKHQSSTVVDSKLAAKTLTIPFFCLSFSFRKTLCILYFFYILLLLVSFNLFFSFLIFVCFFVCLFFFAVVIVFQFFQNPLICSSSFVPFLLVTALGSNRQDLHHRLLRRCLEVVQNSFGYLGRQ